jgi:enamine deaminase RidA (YjgF/YER057c/UK114 family)
MADTPSSDDLQPGQAQQLHRRHRHEYRPLPRGTRQVREQGAPPASTTIGVPQLARPGALFEVEAIAILPPK